MLENAEKIYKSIAGENNIELTNLPDMISSENYCSIMNRLYEDAMKSGNQTQLQYCAMHILAVLQETTNGRQLGKIGPGVPDINEIDYKNIMDQVQKRNRDYKKYSYIEYAISIATEAVLFITIYYFLHVPLIYAVLIITILFTLDLAINKRLQKKRYEKKQLDKYSKEVAYNIRMFNQKYLLS